MARRGYALHLDAPLIDTWRGMICSDMLIMAKSSFSFVPALYHAGLVVVQSYAHAVHARQPEWISFEALVQRAANPAVVNSSALPQHHAQHAHAAAKLTSSRSGHRGAHSPKAAAAHPTP